MAKAALIVTKIDGESIVQTVKVGLRRKGGKQISKQPEPFEVNTFLNDYNKE